MCLTQTIGFGLHHVQWCLSESISLSLQWRRERERGVDKVLVLPSHAVSNACMCICVSLFDLWGD